MKPPRSPRDKRATLSRHYTEDIPEIDCYEIKMALKSMKNNKAAGNDGIMIELIKQGGKTMLNHITLHKFLLFLV